MILDEPNPKVVRQAARTRSINVLRRLAEHPSRFVRVRVAGNKHIDETLHDRLLNDPDQAVVYWALGNPRLTRRQYRKLFTRLLQPEYIPLLHPALAGHRHATVSELREFLKFREWSINLAILNNNHDRPKLQFLRLIKPLLPPEKKKSSDWDEVEQRAYFRTYGVWWKPDEEEDLDATS